MYKQLKLSYSKNYITMELDNSFLKEWVSITSTEDVIPSARFLNNLEKMVNEAYEIGRCDQRAEIRSALGIEVSKKNSNEIEII